MDVYNIIRKRHLTWWTKQPPLMGFYAYYGYSLSRKSLVYPIQWPILLLLLTLSVSNPAQATDSKILFIKSGSASVYNRIIKVAQQRIDSVCQSEINKCAKPSFSVESISNKNLGKLVKERRWDLIVTVGTKAAVRLNSYRAKTDTLYTLIPSHTYPAISKSSASKNKSAIYIDQPIKRQLQLIKTALPDKKKIGVLLGNYSGISKKRLQQIIRDMGLEPVVVKVAPNDIGSNLSSIYSKTEVLLAQPDPSIYNKKTVMTVLLSSYRYNVPVFGYSAAFVKSGATAAIYTSPNNIGRHIGDKIAKFLYSTNSKLSNPSFPKYFSIDTNRRVIRSLNIKIPATKEIKARMIKAR
jgi:ABC-type uncharacterized transport system substrate-binding protein